MAQQQSLPGIPDHEACALGRHRYGQLYRSREGDRVVRLDALAGGQVTVTEFHCLSQAEFERAFAPLSEDADGLA